MCNIDRLDTFEGACELLIEELSNFKDLITTRAPTLDGLEWSFDKGSTKVCSAHEKGLKKRCKVGVTYNLQVELSPHDAEAIWQGFSQFFSNTSLSNIERVSSNEELGRYEFIANNSLGDEITCGIYLLNEWNKPQINILGFVSSRYRKVDYQEIYDEK